MSYECEIVQDSVSEAGDRLTTFQVTFPRFILAEVNTHRMMSRNSASSRAIPIEKSIQAILEDIFIPKAFGAHQKGMQARRSIADYDAEYAEQIWKTAAREAVDAADQLRLLGVHKAWANRLLEPFKWHTAIITATEWGNFFALRDHPDAQPEFQEIASEMRVQYESGRPQLVREDEWHLPLISREELASRPAPWGAEPEIAIFRPDWAYWKPVSIGRCARVSVEQHDGTRDPEADISLHDRLEEKRHLSPFEHVARPFNVVEQDLVEMLQSVLRPFKSQHASYLRRHIEFQGNLRGWHSARMDIVNEHDFSEALALVPQLG